MELNIWATGWWYNTDPTVKKLEKLQEFENLMVMPSIVEAIKKQTPIIFSDVEDIAKTSPKEYQVYKRLEVNSVMAVPFGPKPMGFLVVRNLKRYNNRTSTLNILAYVLHRAIAQKNTMERVRMALTPDEIKTDNDVIINFFGGIEITTSAGVWKEQDFNSPNYDGEWDVSEVVECINDLKGTYNINLDGAEILTKPEYLSLFPLVDQHHLMTNGKAIYENPSLIDLLKQNGITDVSISYHYGIHDEVSSFRSSCVEQTIKLLLSSNFNVTVMTMLNKKNFLLIPDICDFFVSFGIKKVMFANYICQGKNKDRNSILDKNEVNCALNSIHSMRQKYESSDFYVSRTGAFGFDSMHGCNLCCDAGTEGFVILPNRKVCPCVFLCENNFFIGEYAKGCDFLSCSTFAHDFYSCFALENLNYCTDK